VNRRAYIKGWGTIREFILNRAGRRCEQCGAEDGKLGYRDREGVFVEDIDEYERRRAAGQPKTKISLQIAHLDHDTLHNDDSNLAALCQQCHLRHDSGMHKIRRAETRRSKKAIGNLPGLELS